MVQFTTATSWVTSKALPPLGHRLQGRTGQMQQSGRSSHCVQGTAGHSANTPNSPRVCTRSLVKSSSPWLCWEMAKYTVAGAGKKGRPVGSQVNGCDPREVRLGPHPTCRVMDKGTGWGTWPTDIQGLSSLHICRWLWTWPLVSLSPHVLLDNEDASAPVQGSEGRRDVLHRGPS